MDQAGEGQDRENSSEDAENAEGEYEKEKEIINDDKGGTNDGKEKMTDDEEEAGMNTEVKDKQRSEEEAETEDSVSTKRMRRKKRMPDFQFSFNDTGDIDAGSLNDSYDDEGWVPPLKKKRYMKAQMIVIMTVRERQRGKRRKLQTHRAHPSRTIQPG